MNEVNEITMSDDQNNVERVGDLDRKIQAGETSLLQLKNQNVIGFVISIAFVFIIVKNSSTIIGILIGIPYVCLWIWRLYRTDKKIKETTGAVDEYRKQKAELQASSTLK